ncbi:5-methylcytosine restriction system specificity protein McrC [Mycoplasma sp. Z707]|uniref:5-methylcytosine restriction system specificity protein McrC n=1 Tax=Mycoplasma sp. Z707 TaxID=3401691 RepID=UPI003AAD0619
MKEQKDINWDFIFFSSSNYKIITNANIASQKWFFDKNQKLRLLGVEHFLHNKDNELNWYHNIYCITDHRGNQKGNQNANFRSDFDSWLFLIFCQILHSDSDKTQAQTNIFFKLNYIIKEYLKVVKKTYVLDTASLQLVKKLQNNADYLTYLFNLANGSNKFQELQENDFDIIKQEDLNFRLKFINKFYTTIFSSVKLNGRLEFYIPETTLFEIFIYSLIENRLANSRDNVHYQPVVNNILTKVSSTSYLTNTFDFKPDLLILHKNKPTCAIEIKHIIPKAYNNGQYKIHNANLYQLLAYCQALKLKKGVLIYPSFDNQVHEEKIVYKEKKTTWFCLSKEIEISILLIPFHLGHLDENSLNQIYTLLENKIK